MYIYNYINMLSLNNDDFSIWERDLCTTSDSFQLYSPNNSPVKKQLFKANMLILLHIYLDKQLRFRHNSFK